MPKPIKPRYSKLALTLLLASTLTTVGALEFRSTAEHATPFYDAPAATAKKLFVTSRGYPVEVVVDNKDWLRVRDQSGTMAWVEKKALSNKRCVTVTTAKAEVHAAPDTKSPLVLAAEKNVTLELLEPGKNGWAKVRHRDGEVGFVKIEEVWGL